MIKLDLNQSEQGPFLTPIEHPSSLYMKIAYYFTKRKFGKIITPLKVHSARLPFAFGKFYTKIAELDKKLLLSQETVMLLREMVAHINVCRFCIDSNRFVVIEESMNQEKFNELENYKTSSLFDEREKVALDYVYELTTHKKVDKETFDTLNTYFTEREICEIVYVVASEHLYNITNIGLNINSDQLCEIMLNKQI